MKIVFLSYLHGFGGAEKQNVMLANAMAEKGHDVTLISISADNNCYQLNNKVKYEYFPDRKTNVLRIATRYADIRNRLKEIKPDITINFWFQSAYMTAFMKKSITGKVIYSERGDPGDKEYSGALGIIRKIALPRIDGFVFQSKGAQSYFNASVQSRSTIIPNPVFVNAEEYPAVKTRRKAIVTVGRLHPQKNQQLLIHAFKQIADKIPEYTLEIYGDGELKEELQKLIDGLNLSNRVSLMGTSKEIHKLIYDAALFVLSSDYEGLPNTLIEAMALGIPSISTDCKPGGAREIIETGYNGEIVRRDDIDSLATSIYRLLNDESRIEKYSQNGIVISKKFHPDRIYNSWEKFIRIMVESRRDGNI